MNVFATGMNPADANALKRAPRVAIFQAFGEAIRFLQDRGENVTWRRSLVGEPLPPGTDAVIVSSMLPRSLNCPYALGVIWTISEALRLEIPLVLYLTDWAFFKAHSEFKSIAKAGIPYFFKEIGGQRQYQENHEAITSYGHRLLDVCRAYGDPLSELWKRAQVLVPRYTHWGEVQIIQRMLPGANSVLTLDPTPLFLDYLYPNDGSFPPKELPSMDERERRWILPSLLNDNRWLERQYLKWPVDRFGPKGFTVLADERAVHTEYTRRVGALCPPYPTAGSGWWRSRWIHAARARSVLLCDPLDADFLGAAHMRSGPMYELMDFDALTKIAERQRETMNTVLQCDIDVFEEQIYAPFKKAGAL